MKKSEKILAGIVLGFVALVILGSGLRAFFLKPLAKIDKETALLREKLGKINQERREYFEAEESLKKISQRTFASEVSQASARAGEMITREIAAAGLNEADFTRLPAGPRRLRGASEIGWSIQGKGDLAGIVNLLFLLQTSPHLHRLEGVTLSASEKPGEIKARFLYLTLVVEPAPEFDPVELKRQLTLESPERFAYNTILDRDLLRHYIKAPAPKPADPKTDSTRPPGLESLRVVSLSEWSGQPEVHIRDLASQKTVRYLAGDKIGDTEVIAIDYRPLPSSRNPLLTSDSRLILKTGDDFWSVERGQTLADKRKLDPAAWPVR